MQPLVIIPARGGSKGVPGKNIKVLAEKPLIHYTIEAALELFPSERIIVSTDSKEIKSVSEQCKIEVPFIRPEELSTDTASSYDVIIHAVKYAQSKGLNFDTVILLQPTSPFRTPAHIRGAMELYRDDLDMVVSVKVSEANPYYSLFEENEKGLLDKSKEGNFTRRQDCPEVYEYNGAVYVIKLESLLKSKLSEFGQIVKYVMSDRDSLDIDTQLDWIIAETLMNN